jgi:hypothetical protein
MYQPPASIRVLAVAALGCCIWSMCSVRGSIDGCLQCLPALAVEGGEVLKHAALLAEAVRLAAQRHHRLSAVELADPVALVVLLFAGQAACAALHLHVRRPSCQYHAKLPA